jgi:hypothetical protein
VIRVVIGFPFKCDPVYPSSKVVLAIAGVFVDVFIAREI